MLSFLAICCLLSFSLLFVIVFDFIKLNILLDNDGPVYWFDKKFANKKGTQHHSNKILKIDDDIDEPVPTENGSREGYK